MEISTKHLRMITAAVKEHIDVMKWSNAHVPDSVREESMAEWTRLHDMLQDVLLRQ